LGERRVRRLLALLAEFGRMVVAGVLTPLVATAVSAVWMAVAAVVLTSDVRADIGPVGTLFAMLMLGLYVTMDVVEVALPPWVLGWGVASGVAAYRGVARHRAGRVACGVAALCVLAGLAFSRTGLAGTSPVGMLALNVAPGLLVAAVLVGRWMYPAPVAR
jgi:hypothetical protein